MSVLRTPPFPRSGGKNRLYYHRNSHCADCDLPKRLFAKRHEFSYFIVVLDELMMTETDMRKLFADMDAIADDPAHDPLDCQISFRRLQKEHFPNLTREQFLGLFEIWGTQYAARIKAQRDEAVRNVVAFARAAAGIVPRRAPFKASAAWKATRPIRNLSGYISRMATSRAWTK